MTDDTGPVETPLDDPNHQDLSPDLPDPVTGNDDSDESEEGEE